MRIIIFMLSALPFSGIMEEQERGEIMVTLTRRQFSILRTLQSRHGRISSEHLSKIIGSSSKTIRKDILDMREELEALP